MSVGERVSLLLLLTALAWVATVGIGVALVSLFDTFGLYVFLGAVAVAFGLVQIDW
jgi:hypothetical protein